MFSAGAAALLIASAFQASLAGRPAAEDPWRPGDVLTPKQLDAWANRFLAWAGGGEPDDLPRVDQTTPTKTRRDVFAYVIHEGKVRAPAGAMELIARVK